MLIKQFVRILSTTYLCVLLLFSFATKVHAEVDTLKQIWLNETLADSMRFSAINEFCKNNIYSEPTRVLEVVDFHYELAKRMLSENEVVNAISNKVNALKALGEYERALDELSSLIDIRTNCKDTIGLANAYGLAGKIYHYQSKYLNAVKYLTESLRLYQIQNYEIGQTRIYNSLASVYLEINNFDLAMEYYDKGKQFAQKLNQEEILNYILLNVGFINFEKKNYEEAIFNSHLSKQYFLPANNLIGLADSYYLLAQSHQALNQIDSAFHYSKKAVETNLVLGNDGQIIPCKLLLANILLESSTKESAKIVTEMLPLIDNSYGYSYLAEAHHTLYRCYKAQGDMPLALEMLEKYTIYNDSLIIEEDDLAITKHTLQTKYEIELLNKELESEKAHSKLEYNQLKRTFAILSICGLVLILSGYFARLKFLAHRREREELLEEIKELKKKENTTLSLVAPKFELKRENIEIAIKKKINETDWKVLNILLDDPVISNKDIAAKAFLTVDGIGSCLRRMYIAFEVKESKYKKISLIMKAIKLSNTSSDLLKESSSKENN